MAYRDLPGHRAPATEPDWLTLGQAAKYLGVAQSTIRKWSDHGRVPAFYTPGGHRRYRRADLDKFLESPGPGAGGVGVRRQAVRSPAADRAGEADPSDLARSSGRRLLRLELFGRFEKPGDDHGDRREQTDPDPDPAAVRGQELLRDRDQADEDDHRREGAERDHD